MKTDSAEAQAELLKALAHPVRLRLLEELAREEECVCHLALLLDKPQPYISQQLAALREAGLVLDRRDGQRVFYQIANDGIAELLATLRRVTGSTDPVNQPRHPIPGCSCPKCAE